MHLYPEDTRVRGNVQATFMKMPSASVGDEQFKNTDPVTADKIQHRIMRIYRQRHGVNAYAERRVIHVAKEAGFELDLGVSIGAVVPATGDSTVTIDVRRNGTSVLSGGALVLTSAYAAYERLEGFWDDDSFAAGQVIELVVTVSAGTGTLPQGVFVQYQATEKPIAF